VFDSDNGKKTNYYDDYTVKLECSLLNGKLNPFKFYDEKNIKSGIVWILSGKTIEYDEDGQAGIDSKKNSLLLEKTIKFLISEITKMMWKAYTWFYYDDATNKLSLKRDWPICKRRKKRQLEEAKLSRQYNRKDIILYTNYLKALRRTIKM
jgi:hypothetical protein